MEILVYGLINSASLALMALGFSLAYGVSRIPNFAHGAIYILTGFVAWVFMNRLGFPYPVSIAISIASSAVLGLLIYYLVLIRVRGMEMSEIIATYAIGLALLETFRWAGFKGTTYTLPAFMGGAVQIFGVPVDWQRILAFILCVLIFFLLWLFTHFTKVGLSLRGIAQDERAAMMLGIDSDLAAAIAMALGSALAGTAAIILLPLGSIVVEGGYDVLIFALAVCVVGGLGSWLGVIAASLLIGFLQTITVAYLKPHFHLVVALIVIIVTLIFEPSGFFGKQKELEERV